MFGPNSRWYRLLFLAAMDTTGSNEASIAAADIIPMSDTRLRVMEQKVNFIFDRLDQFGHLEMDVGRQRSKIKDQKAQIQDCKAQIRRMQIHIASGEDQIRTMRLRISLQENQMVEVLRGFQALGGGTALVRRVPPPPPPDPLAPSQVYI